jgi:hypothetical protein
LPHKNSGENAPRVESMRLSINRDAIHVQIVALGSLESAAIEHARLLLARASKRTRKSVVL